MIAAYAREASLRAGETLELCISNDRPCRVFFVRCGATIQKMPEHADTTIRPQRVDLGEAGFPWNWPAHRFEIPSSWKSGVYVAVLDDAIDDRLDARSARALFVLRSRLPIAAVAYNIPIFTFHAYNVALDQTAESTCLYNNAPAVTLLRPGGGIGGHTWDEAIADVYDTSSPRQTFAHWDLSAIAWLESRIEAIDYLCDLDLHRDEGALAGYELLLGFGHHEYWSDAMRAALLAHLQRGGNAAFFTGNTAYFRIRYDDQRAAISRLGRWDAWPEEQTFGVSYRYGGGKWRGERPASGFVVDDANHWIYEGCGLSEDDVFGAPQRLVGYECDGAPPNPPACFHALGHSDISDWPVADGSGELSAEPHATLGLVQQHGSLFVAGTVDWPRVLHTGEPTVERITRNIIGRLAPSLGLKGVGTRKDC